MARLRHSFDDASLARFREEGQSRGADDTISLTARDVPARLPAAGRALLSAHIADWNLSRVYLESVQSLI